MSLMIVALALALHSQTAESNENDLRDAQCYVQVERARAALPESEREAVSGLLQYYLGKMVGRFNASRARELVGDARARIEHGQANAPMIPSAAECGHELSMVTREFDPAN